MKKVSDAGSGKETTSAWWHHQWSAEPRNVLRNSYQTDFQYKNCLPCFSIERSKVNCMFCGFNFRFHSIFSGRVMVKLSFFSKSHAKQKKNLIRSSSYQNIGANLPPTIWEFRHECYLKKYFIAVVHSHWVIVECNLYIARTLQKITFVNNFELLHIYNIYFCMFVLNLFLKSKSSSNQTCTRFFHHNNVPLKLL